MRNRFTAVQSTVCLLDSSSIVTCVDATALLLSGAAGEAPAFVSARPHRVRAAEAEGWTRPKGQAGRAAQVQGTSINDGHIQTDKKKRSCA